MLDLFKQLGIALGLGLLVGLQRERTHARLAGFRTFPLVTLFGALCALLAREFGGWIVAAGLVGLALVIVVGNLSTPKTNDQSSGVTTEAAMLVMFATGGCLFAGYTAVATAIAGTTAVLLNLKPEMHALAAQIGEGDFKAIMQFVLVTLVILPVLPNRYYGPYHVLNPFVIWMMVVLIVGISLGGYISYKLVGPKAGAWASGILGGLISSTATTVSYARRSRETPESGALAAFVVLIASAMAFVRVLILIAFAAPGLLRFATIPMAVLFVVLTAAAVWSWKQNRAQSSSVAEQANPSRLKPALLFAAVYAVVSWASAAARDTFGQGGLYLVAIVSGLTEMDAITLSLTQMLNTGKISPDTAWRCIVAGSMSNLIFKTLTVAVIADRRLLFRIGAAFAATFTTGLLLLAFLK